MPQDLDVKNVLQQLLQGQASGALDISKKMEEINTKVACSYNDLHKKLEALSSKVQEMETKGNNGDKVQQSSSNGKEKEYCNAIFSKEPRPIEDHEAATNEIELLLYGSQAPLKLNEDIEEQGGGVTLEKNENVTLVECKDLPSSTRIEPKSLPKLGNPGKFSIACSLGDLKIEDALCDSGSSVNVMSHEMLKSLGIRTLAYHPSPITFGDASSRKPLGLLEDYPLTVGDCIVPTDFVVMEMKKTKKLPLLLGTPFLLTTGARMDFKDQRVVLLNVDDTVYYPMRTSSNKLCGTITIKDDEFCEEEARYVGRCEMVEEAPPPKVYEEEEKSLERKDLGYGNDKEASEVDIACLEPLPPATMENDVEGSKGAKKKTKAKANLGNGSSKLHGSRSEPSQPSMMTLTPWKHKDGVIEYKIKCKGRPKPFASVKAILTPELKEKGEAGLEEVMSKVLKLELKDPPWSAHTPFSPA